MNSNQLYLCILFLNSYEADRKTEHFKALTNNSHSSAIADHITQTGHRIKWDYFDILATGQSDIHCKIKETVTSEDVCWSIRNVKFLNESFYNMRCVVMFITAVCLIFLLKLKWPKNKIVYDLSDVCSFLRELMV